MPKIKSCRRSDGEPQPVPLFVPPLHVEAEDALDPPPPGTIEWLNRRFDRFLAALQAANMRAKGEKLQ